MHLLQKCEIEFDRKVIQVYFNPYVEQKFLNCQGCFDAYDEFGLMPIIQTISTRFSKVEMPSVYEWHKINHASIVFIPTAVAKFNQRLSSKLNNKGNSSFRKNLIDLTVTFYIDETKDTSTFDIAKELVIMRI